MKKDFFFLVGLYLFIQEELSPLRDFNLHFIDQNCIRRVAGNKGFSLSIIAVSSKEERG